MEMPQEPCVFKMIRQTTKKFGKLKKRSTGMLARHSLFEASTQWVPTDERSLMNLDSADFGHF